MQLPLQLTVRDLSLSEAAEADIHAKAAHLDTYYDGIMSCRVVVEGPGRHHRRGPFTVRIDLSVPGAEVDFVEEPGEKGPQASTVAIAGISGL
jgi:hypothetical protein